MLTMAGFYHMTYAQQADLLLNKGTFLQSRQEGNFIIDLYELADLLVEIFYQKNTNEPTSVMAYNTMEKIKTLFPKNIQPRLTIKKVSDSYQQSHYAA